VELDGTPRRSSSALKDGNDSLPQRLQGLRIFRPDGIRPGRIIRDDIRRLPRLQDDRLDRLRLLDLLPQTRQPIIRHDDGVAGVLPVPRRVRRMRRLAVERRPELPRRARDQDGRGVVLHRVRHQAHVAVPPGAVVRHDVFPSAGLLGWGAHHHDCAWDAKCLHRVRGAYRGGEGCCRDEVVAAGVADLGEGIYFKSIERSIGFVTISRRLMALLYTTRAIDVPYSTL